MGKDALADISSNHFQMPAVQTTSVASNGANALEGFGLWVAPANGKLRSAYRVVYANEATVGTATTSASYRRHRIINGGSAGSGTTIIASLNQTVSQASRTSRAYTLESTPSFSAGDILLFDQITVGGNNDDATVVAVSSVNVEYELL
jgi:hypothetical protein